MTKKFFIIISIFIVFGGLGIWQLTKAQSAQGVRTSHETEMSPKSSPTVTQSTGVVDLTNKKEVTVTIKDMKYTPQHIKVTKGTKVTWINEDEMEHNVMKAHEHDEKPHDVSHMELDPKEFEGPMLKKGDSYSFTFDEVSENLYHCAPHPWMQGSVTVE